jgi:phytoene dehydrogenase-like protein
MSQQFDVVVIGAGQNGLMLANRLNKKGKKVLVLEKEKVIGGLAAKREFANGFFANGILQDTTMVRKKTLAGLNLDQQLGWNEWAPTIFTPTANGLGLALHGDLDKVCLEIAKHSQKDATAFRTYRAFVARISKPMRKFLTTVPAHFESMSVKEKWELLSTGLSVRLLGKKDMHELMRVPPMPVYDWLNEFFECEELKASLALDAVSGTTTGPWSPGTAMNLLYKEVLREVGIKKGPSHLVHCLKQNAEKNGVVFKTNSLVQKVLMNQNQAAGVLLASGESIKANTVVSTLDPKNTFTKLLDPSLKTQVFQENLKNFRMRGTVGVMNLGLTAPLRFKGQGQTYEFARVVPSLVALEKAFDATKYQEMSEIPCLEIYMAKAENADLAPAGKSTVQILVHYVPYINDQKKNELLKSQMKERVLNVLKNSVETLTVEAMEILTPFDLETTFGLTGGHLHHGEHAIDQLLVRPFPACARYESPYDGFYLCGSGSFPGGNLTCLPGHLASTVIQ